MFCARRAGIPRWLQAHVPRRWRETSGFSLLGTQSSAEIPLPLQCVILGPLRSTCQALTPRPSGQGLPRTSCTDRIRLFGVSGNHPPEVPQQVNLDTQPCSNY